MPKVHGLGRGQSSLMVGLILTRMAVTKTPQLRFYGACWLRLILNATEAKFDAKMYKVGAPL